MDQLLLVQYVQEPAPLLESACPTVDLGHMITTVMLETGNVNTAQQLGQTVSHVLHLLKVQELLPEPVHAKTDTLTTQLHVSNVTPCVEPVVGLSVQTALPVQIVLS